MPNNQPLHVWALIGLGLFFFLAAWVSGVMFARHMTPSDVIGPVASQWFQTFMFSAAVLLDPGRKPPTVPQAGPQA